MRRPHPTRHRVRRLLAAGAVALVVAGCGTGGASEADDGDTAAAGACDELQRPKLQESSHLLGDQPPPVPYSSTPPTSGWHSGGRPIDPGAYAQPVAEVDQVLWLEVGGVVVAYDPSLPDEVVAELNQLPGQVEMTVVTPYETAMPTPIALTAWGVLQRCESVDAATVRAFRERFGGTTEDHG